MGAFHIFNPMASNPHNGFDIFPPQLTNAAHDKNDSFYSTLCGLEQFTLDLSGRIISSNLEAIDITGYNEWEVMGKHLSLLYDDEQQATADLDAVLKTGNVVAKRWMHTRKRTRFLGEISMQVNKDSLHQPVGFTVTVKDLTRNDAYDLHILKLREEYIHLFQNSFVGIIKFDLATGRIILANSKATEILGPVNAESIASVFYDRTDFVRLTAALRERGRAIGQEFRVAGTTGERWTSIDCIDIGMDNVVEGIVFDVTLKVLQNRELERVNRELNTFIYHASHDLRSPLASILGLVNLIRTENPEQQVRTYNEMIGERTCYLDKLLKDLSLIAFNNQSDLVPERVFLKEELEAIAESLRYENPQAKVYITVDQRAEFVTDLVRIRAVFRNLISNGLKFANRISSSQFVRVHLDADEYKLQCTVEDNGIGIANEDLRQIYELFFRGETASKGSGLGLYLVKQIMDKLKGTILVESDFSKGTTFRLQVPNLQSQLNPAARS